MNGGGGSQVLTVHLNWLFAVSRLFCGHWDSSYTVFFFFFEGDQRRITCPSCLTVTNPLNVELSDSQSSPCSSAQSSHVSINEMTSAELPPSHPQMCYEYLKRKPTTKCISPLKPVFNCPSQKKRSRNSASECGEIRRGF